MTQAMNPATSTAKPPGTDITRTTTSFPDYRHWHDVVERISQLEEMIVEARQEDDDYAALAIVSLAEELRTQRHLLQLISDR